MTFPIVVSNRLIKIVANILKGFSYIFHFIFPKKRFTIPLLSKAKINSKEEYKIPKIIWQTNYTNKVSLPVYLNYLFNRLMSLDYEYRYVSTEDRLDFLEKNAPKELFEAFKKLTDGAAQADVWRLFVLNHIGGIYMDIDAHLVWPLSKIIKKEDTEVILENKDHYTNYFIASAKNNPVLSKSLDIIVENINEEKIDGGVYSLTGPVVLNLAIGDKEVNHRFYRYTCVQGSFTNEYFQYIDKPRGKWTHVKKEDLLKK
ncbi:MAG: glycosyltransferase [Thiovulaceae bacterium]|nr:glycosyltransferase [Sulfurimonadaceae bacterium]